MKTSRTKKAVYNVASSLLLEFISIISAFILPKLILSHFGSSYNGITTSIGQFLSFVTLLRAGVGGVTRAALYKPLADHDSKAVSEIVMATEIFMRKIAIVFSFMLVGFAFIYPLLVQKEFEWLFTFSLILIIGLSTFAQYYFGITYQMLLGADQKQYINALIQGFSMILNIVVSVILISADFSIHIVKLGSSLVFSLNPIILYIYVHKKYKIQKDVKPNYVAINQRWDAFMHQVAAFVQENTDVVVLTMFSTLKEVSVYSVYHLVTNGVKKLLETITVGLESAFGNMIALNDYESLDRNVKRLELVLFSVATVAYSCVLNLIVPFIMVYTKGIVDADYSRPIFALVLTLAQFFYCIRTPYQYVVEAAGHFKQTKNGALFEAVINLFLSIVFVINFGLVGVAIGTLVSMAIRTVQYANYTSNKILNRGIYFFIKRLSISFVSIIIITIIVQFSMDGLVSNYLIWFFQAVYVCVVSIIVVAISNCLFDLAYTKDCLVKILSIVK